MRNNNTLKIYKGGKIVSRLSSHSIRHFLNHLRTINFSKGIEKVYLRISYGSHKDAFNKVSSFYNEGYYENPQDLMQAFESFNELEPKDFVVEEAIKGEGVVTT